MVKQTQTIRWQQPANCLSMFDHFVGLPSLCWIAYGQIIHLFVEGLLLPIGTTPLCFKVCFFYVSEVHVNMSDHRVIFQCHVITCMIFISWRLFFESALAGYFLDNNIANMMGNYMNTFAT